MALLLPVFAKQLSFLNLNEQIMTYDYYPAPAKANLLAEIEERLELLNEIFEKYEPSERLSPKVRSVMTTLVGSYGYTYEEYQYGVDMA